VADRFGSAPGEPAGSLFLVKVTSPRIAIGTQGELLRRLRLPPQSAQQLLGDAQSTGDLVMDQIGVLRRQPRAAFGEAAQAPESLKPALAKASLVAAHDPL